VVDLQAGHLPMVMALHLLRAESPSVIVVEVLIQWTTVFLPTQLVTILHSGFPLPLLFQPELLPSLERMWSTVLNGAFHRSFAVVAVISLLSREILL
jgi:hypothetical protein